MKYSLCLDPLFEGYDYYDKAKLAAEIGYDGIELWKAAEADPSKMRRVCEESGIRMAAFVCGNAWVCHMSAPPRTVLQNLEENLRVAKELDAEALLLMSGNRLHSVPCQQSIITENLRRAAPLAERYGVLLLLEPLNSLIDHRGYFLDNSGVGYEIMKCVDSPYVGLLFDIYHMQVMEGNLIGSLTENVAYTGHIHAAGVPGRHEPYLGEVSYPAVLAALERAGYRGYVGAEYFPTIDSARSAAKTLEYLKLREERSSLWNKSPSE